MARPVRLLLGILLLLVGLVWFFQGIGVLEGSFMTDQPVWAVIGVALIVIGAGVLFRGRPTPRN
jgi:hypothetical protein